MIVYRFDKERFNKNADKGIKRILSKHLDYIDNLEVKFIDGEEWGTVENYVVGQERYCLYPVKKEWCSIEEQLRIIWNYCELSGGIWMRVRYSKRLKELELNNEDFLLIPLKKDSIALELDGSLFDFNKDTNVRINFKNFMINGKPTLKYKIKTIWWIMKMK